VTWKDLIVCDVRAHSKPFRGERRSPIRLVACVNREAMVVEMSQSGHHGMMANMWESEDCGPCFLVVTTHIKPSMLEDKLKSTGNLYTV